MAKRNGRPRLLTAADLTQRKPLETLLRALTKVPDAELLVVGGPAESELPQDDNYVKLAKFAATLGIADRVIFTGKVGSLRRFKDDVKEVAEGFECGLQVAKFQDLKVGDIVEAYTTEHIAAELVRA